MKKIIPSMKAFNNLNQSFQHFVEMQLLPSTKESKKDRKPKTTFYHHYFSFDMLKSALKQTELIEKLQVIDDMLHIICTFCGITKWSQTDKSSQIRVINSKDDNIEYAIITQDSNQLSTINQYHNIFVSDWINAVSLEDYW